MKQFLLITLIALPVIVFTNCSDDEDVNNPPVDPAEYSNADGIIGGIMYDKFWAVEAGFNQSDPNLAKFNQYADFFRCKQCHAWDYLGDAGSYINRAPRTSRPNIAHGNILEIAKSKTAQELFDAMKKSTGRRDISYDLSTYNPTTNNTEGDKMPDYSQLLTDAQIWDIVKYLKTEAIDVNQLYDGTYTGTYPTGSASYSNLGKGGNAPNGATFFAQRCAPCHAPDGTAFLVENMTVGKFTRNKPNEVQHKVKFGQLGSSMGYTENITLQNMKDLYKALADTVAFPN